MSVTQYIYPMSCTENGLRSFLAMCDPKMPLWAHFATIVHFLPFHSSLSCCERSVLSATVFLEIDEISVCCLFGQFLLVTAHSSNSSYFSISFSTISAASFCPHSGRSPSFASNRPHNWLACSALYWSLIDISLFHILNILFNGPSDGVAPSVAAFNITLYPQYCSVGACISYKLLLAKKFPAFSSCSTSEAMIVVEPCVSGSVKPPMRIKVIRGACKKDSHFF